MLDLTPSDFITGYAAKVCVQRRQGRHVRYFTECAGNSNDYISITVQRVANIIITSLAFFVAYEYVVCGMRSSTELLNMSIEYILTFLFYNMNANFFLISF